jgi:hypothetical protein
MLNPRRQYRDHPHLREACALMKAFIPRLSMTKSVPIK